MEKEVESAFRYFGNTVKSCREGLNSQYLLCSEQTGQDASESESEGEIAMMVGHLLVFVVSRSKPS